MHTFLCKDLYSRGTRFGPFVRCPVHARLIPHLPIRNMLRVSSGLPSSSSVPVTKAASFFRYHILRFRARNSFRDFSYFFWAERCYDRRFIMWRVIGSFIQHCLCAMIGKKLSQHQHKALQCLHTLFVYPLFVPGLSPVRLANPPIAHTCTRSCGIFCPLWKYCLGLRVREIMLGS